jgi:hypothetical protein
MGIMEGYLQGQSHFILQEDTPHAETAVISSVEGHEGTPEKTH